jgi:hypothetical protein
MIEERPYWRHPVLLAALLLAVAIPLLGPPVPPITDLPGHIARYHVELDLSRSADLQRFYGFRWALIGNLGVDLLIVPMAKLFGIELGAKLIVLFIPMMLAAGFLAVARELHGRIPPTALFALPLAYHWPFQFGFVNFSLSAALCFLAFALWLRLLRGGRLRLRAAIFVPLAALIWLAHTYGWGLLGILAFSAETAGRRERGLGWVESVWRGGLACLPLMLPFLLMLLWRGGAVAGDTGDWNVTLKLNWLISILREHWMGWDVASALLLWSILLMAVLRIDFRLVLTVRIALVLLALLFCLIPRVLIGSGFADMRLAPMIAAIGILGITTEGGRLARHERTIAALALLFFTARIAVTTAVYADLSAVWQRQLKAVAHIDRGSRVLVQAYAPCINVWSSNRVDHVSSLAVVRRDVFTNGQWALAGAQLLQLKYRAGDPFVEDPSHLLRPPNCAQGPAQLRKAVEVAPHAFDYLWLVDVPRHYWPSDARLEPVWQEPTGILYRIRPARGVRLSRTPTGG